jgi:hypothetical protein
MKERRRFVRWQLDWQSELKLEGAQNFANCVIGDLSFKGTRLLLRLKLPKDKYLKLTLVLSKDYVIDIEVWTVWHKTVDELHCYGLYFTKVRDSDKEKIYQFARKYCPGEICKHWWQEEKKEGGEIMPEQRFEDRRIFDRFQANMSLRFINLKENKEGEACTENISAKGMGLTTNDQLLPRTPLEILLQIPDKGEPLYARGEVVWANKVLPNKYRIGVNLERADLMGLSRILRVIKSE